METKTGLEIVHLHQEYEQRIQELTNAIQKLDDYDYTKSVLGTQLEKLHTEIKNLEQTRFQALEPVVIGKSLLGGRP